MDAAVEHAVMEDVAAVAVAGTDPDEEFRVIAAAYTYPRRSCNFADHQTGSIVDKT